MSKSVTVNAEQALYVIPCHGGGYTCLGFDYAEHKRKEVCAWSKLTQAETKPGTLAHYAAYSAAMVHGAEYAKRTGTRCSAELTPELVPYEGDRVEVVDCYGETRRFIVSKSTGWMPCHLEIAKVNSCGGMAVTGAPFKSVKLIKANVR